MIGNDILRKADSLRDDRTIQQRAAAMRNLVKLPGPSVEDQNLAAYRQAVRQEKLDNMTPAARRLAEYEEAIENRDAPPVEKPQAKASPKQAKVLALIEKIVNENRPRGDFEEAAQVYEQLGPGMDHAIGDQWYDALAANQQKYLLGKQSEMQRQRAALQEQVNALSAEMSEFVPSASLVEQRIKLLHGYANKSGKPLPDGMTHDDVVNARNALEAGDSAAAVDVISRASEVIDQWQASIAEAS